MKEGDLPESALAVRRLENALNGSTLGILLGTMNAATKAGQPPLEVLFKTYTKAYARYLRVPAKQP